MGVLFDYFSAVSDDEAAQVAGWPGGPGCPPPGCPAKDFVVTKIDVCAQLGRLESLLTGRSYDEITRRPLHAGEVALHPDRGVMTVTDEFSTALATAGDDRLAAVAGPWARTDEFWGAADPVELELLLRELRGLARRAHQNGMRLYCWLSL
ncbi:MULTISPECIES: hypothetical protein [Thermomonosporaceae]|uniref:hypothetical protein n=1 Tax=Thermomonosporaceae TaxID=2012 RepID=UPI00255AF03E|nr:MULTISPECIES: hypothetical protein [Thermomonosporaceae]MDL4773219.1 hypothetical protein [Actinomadura xylanilytica]